jgi:acetyltransferase-like isoleucine patch superfamily enzyme
LWSTRYQEAGGNLPGRTGRLYVRERGRYLPAGPARQGAAVHRDDPPELRRLGAAVGAGTWFGSGCWLNAIGGTITVGDGCSFAGDVTISAAVSVTLGRDVLVARGVHISDHDHAFTDPGRPARRQGITNAAPVMVGDGAWLGHNVTVTAGVSIGRGAVIAAGAVVTRDVPPCSLAVGIPAQVVRSWAPVTAPP